MYRIVALVTYPTFIQHELNHLIYRSVFELSLLRKHVHLVLT